MGKNKGFWNVASIFYTFMQEKKNKRLYSALNEFALQYVNNTKEVLEVGCGTGQMTKALAPISKSYIATDYSPGMIKKAKRRKIEKAELKVMDSCKIDYEDESFDIVVAANILHIIPDIDSAMQEIYRVLKPGGLLIAPTFLREGKIHKGKLFMLSLFGFKTYHKWSAKEFLDLLFMKGFTVIDRKDIPASPTMNMFVVGKKK